MKKNDHKTVHKTYINTLGVPHCHRAMGIFVHSCHDITKILLKVALNTITLTQLMGLTVDLNARTVVKSNLF
jgi:hypothetical protein